MTPHAQIIGAGPVGLLLACRLASTGWNIDLFEKRRGLPTLSMAIGITPPSLHFLHRLGLHDAFERAGIPIRRCHVLENRRPIGTLGFENAGDHILSLPQADTLRILRQHAATLPGITFHEGLEHDPASPIPDGSWRIACDGARSPHREHLRIPFRLRPYPQRFLMADFNDIEAAGPDARLFFSPRGSVESFPLPHGLRRWVVQLLPGTPETIPHLIDRVRDAANVNLHHVPHGTPSLFQPRFALADTYLHGRTLLCGDAAHLLSPIGGQGMNTGFADAWSLANALERGPHALPAWQRQRQRAFRAAARRAALGMHIGTLTGPIASHLRAAALHTALSLPHISNTLAQTYAMRNLPHPLTT